MNKLLKKVLRFDFDTSNLFLSYVLKISRDANHHFTIHTRPYFQKAGLQRPLADALFAGAAPGGRRMIRNGFVPAEGLSNYTRTFSTNNPYIFATISSVIFGIIFIIHYNVNSANF